jgi:hypothetical protein
MQSLECFQSNKAVDEIAGSVSERRDMRDRWLAFLGRHVFRYSLCHTLPDSGFQINARSRSVNGFTLARFVTINGTAQLARVSSDIIADASNSYVISDLLT